MSSAKTHYRNQCWPRSITAYGVTRAQLVNLSLSELNHNGWRICRYRICWLWKTNIEAHGIASLWQAAGVSIPRHATRYKPLVFRRVRMIWTLIRTVQDPWPFSVTCPAPPSLQCYITTLRSGLMSAVMRTWDPTTGRWVSSSSLVHRQQYKDHKE